MTKKIFFTVLTVFHISFTTNSYAECDGFYIAGRIGQAKIELEDSRSGFNDYSNDKLISKRRLMASGAIGYRYEHWRAELEYVWRKKNDKATDIATQYFRSQSYMFVVYYDFFPYTWFTPFVNAGVGYTKNKLKSIGNPNFTSPSYNISNSEFTWSLGAGISAKITNRWNMDIGYRYYDMGDLDTFNGKTKTTDQEIYMGLRYVL